MSKKSTALSPLKRPSTRSLSSSKGQPTTVQEKAKDKYTFQSDDEDHQTKPVLVRKTITPSVNKRTRGRPPKTPKQDGTTLRTSLSSSNIESDISSEEGPAIKRKPSGKNYEKPVTRRASRLVSQTNTPIGDKVQTPKKRPRKSKMSNATVHDPELDKSKPQSEAENIVPANALKRRPVKKKTLSTDTNPKMDINEQDDQNLKLSSVDEKELMQFGSPQHPTQQTPNQTNTTSVSTPINVPTHQSDDDFSDDSVDFVWKGSSKLSIEILKRRIPKDEPKDQYSSTPSDPNAQRKRAIIPRLTNFDALSSQTNDTSTISTPIATKRTNQEPTELNIAKKSSSVITLNNVFQNDFVPSYNDAGTKMTTTTTNTTTSNTTEEKPRPRIYAVKSTTMKARPQQSQQSQQQASTQPEIKRPKWMNDQQGKSEEEEEEDQLPPPGEEPDDFDYVPKGQYIPKRPSYRGRGTLPGRRGTGMRGRPPGSRRQFHDDDDDDDYDQYEDTHLRHGSRKQTSYRSARPPMFDMGDDNGDYDRNRRMSLTQAYRRNTAVRPPLGSMSGQRRIAINNGNHPIYKPFKSSSYRPTPATLGLSTTNRRASSTSRSPVSTISQPHHHLSSTISKHYSDDDYYHQQGAQARQTTTSTVATATSSGSNATGQTFVTKMNDHQLNDVANQSQIFFVNMPQQEQKAQQQVLSVLTTDQQQQQQVLPVTVVQQVKLPMDAPKQKKILPKPSSNNSQLNTSAENASNVNNKPYAWSRPPVRIGMSNEEQTGNNKNMHSSQTNTDLDTMEAAHVLATAADVTMAADARRKAQQHDDEIHMIVDETPSTIVSEETIQCDNDAAKLLSQQQFGTITANIIDENGVEHTVYLSTEEAQQLLGSQGAIIVDSDGQPISIQQPPQPPPTQTFVSPFALDQAQLQALLVQAGIDPNTPLTIEQVDPNQVQQGQQQSMATLCTSPGGTQYTVLTQGPAQQQFILQTTTTESMTPTALPMIQSATTTTPTVSVQAQTITPKDETGSPPPKRRAFAVKSTTTASRADSFDDINANDRPRRKIFATKSTVTAMNEEMPHDEEGIIGTRAYHRNVPRK